MQKFQETIKKLRINKKVMKVVENKSLSIYLNIHVFIGI